jgi:hypothetical protein
LIHKIISKFLSNIHPLRMRINLLQIRTLLWVLMIMLHSLLLHEMFKTKRIRICIGSIYYRQTNKQLVIMVLQRHASAHTSHRQVTFRTVWFKQYYYLLVKFWRLLFGMKWWLFLHWYERNFEKKL